MEVSSPAAAAGLEQLAAVLRHLTGVERHAGPVLGSRGEAAEQPVGLDPVPDGQLEPREGGDGALARRGGRPHLPDGGHEVLPGAVGEGAHELVTAGEVPVHSAAGQAGGGRDGVETGGGVAQERLERGLEQAAAVELRITPAASGGVLHPARIGMCTALCKL